MHTFSSERDGHGRAIWAESGSSRMHATSGSLRILPAGPPTVTCAMHDALVNVLLVTRELAAMLTAGQVTAINRAC